ncbi:glycosyltransferase family A protein [Roseivivax isoporae]|uniref:glycosyltransferase family A protein n=1 Tax=Roseivivax isoporae TaxID=591206 RepID=UPI0004BC2316|nr:glycosyltransferase family A protein [Roseivivax isoporae]
MAVISLSSVPPRFPRLHDTLDTILTQRRHDLEIWLNIPRAYRRFPDWDGSVPRVDRRIRIIRAEEDLGPATKVLPAVTELRGSDDQILFCDDDRLYEPDWAQRLLHEQSLRPEMCVAAIGRHLSDVVPEASDRLLGQRAILGPVRDTRYTMQRLWQRLREHRNIETTAKPAKPRVKRAGFTEILQGFAGVVIRPSFFDDAAFTTPTPLIAVDDICLSGHLARRGVPIWLPAGIRVARRSQNHQVEALKDQIVEGMIRQELDRLAVAYFQEKHGIWL